MGGVARCLGRVLLARGRDIKIPANARRRLYISSDVTHDSPVPAAVRRRLAPAGRSLARFVTYTMDTSPHAIASPFGSSAVVVANPAPGMFDTRQGGSQFLTIVMPHVAFLTEEPPSHRRCPAPTLAQCPGELFPGYCVLHDCRPY